MSARAAFGCVLMLVAALVGAAPSRSQQAVAPGVATGLPDGSARRLLGPAAQAPLAAVGRVVNSGSEYHCTGTLIAPDLVLSAAHCGWSRRAGRPAPAHRLVFYPHYRQDTRRPSFRGTALAIPAAYATTQEIVDDLLLIRLSTTVPESVARPLRVIDRTALRGHRLAVYSYGYDARRALAAETDCRALAALRGAMVTSCEAVGGISGAPVVVRDLASGERRLTAVVSSRLGQVSRAGRPGRAVVVPVDQARIASLLDRLSP